MSTKLALIVFSNPSDTGRLALDREHRAVDEALAKSEYSLDVVRRLHASRIDDVLVALRDAQYDILHISGHGQTSGIVVECDDGSPQLITAPALAALIAAGAHRFRVVLCLTCFSGDYASALACVADYVVGVDGALSDDSAIRFVRTFYECYAGKDSIETSFYVARERALLDDPAFSALLWRRGTVHAGSAAVAAFPGSASRSILVDVTDARADIQRLGLVEADVLRNLTRKLAVHRWIFSTPRERVLLPLGRYIGMFSWSNESEVRCQQLIRISPDVGEEASRAFVRLTIAYNDLFVAYYRTQAAYDPSLRMAVKKAIDDHRTAATQLFNDGEWSGHLRVLAADEFKLARAIVLENVLVADRKYAAEAYGEAAGHLEAALSAMHDLIEALSERIAAK